MASPPTHTCLHDHPETLVPSVLSQIDEAPSQVLRTYSHEPTFLVQVVEHYLPSHLNARSEFSLDIQIYAALDFDSEGPEPTEQILSGPVTDERVIRRYFRLFDKTFFFGMLGHWGRLLIDDPVGVRSSCSYGGVTEPSGFQEKITIDLSLLPQTPVREALAILLENMCGAFLTMFSCRSCRRSLGVSNLNLTAWGLAWQKLTYAIELELPKYFQTKTLDLFLERLEPLANGLARHGVELVDDRELQRHGLSIGLFRGRSMAELNESIAEKELCLNARAGRRHQ